MPRLHQSQLSTRLSTLLSPLILTLILVAVGCSAAPPPISRPDLHRPPDVPLIFVPGILGSKLEERKSGNSLWGKGHDVVWPRDHGYEIAFPITDRDWQQDDRVALEQAEAVAVVDKVKFLTYTRVVYQRLSDLFEAHGYQPGDPKNPHAEDTFFMFAYDFRRDNVAIARELYAFLDELRRVHSKDMHSEESLEIDLLCQSNGAHLCRYLSKYGNLTLEQALSGTAPEQRTIRIRKLALVGTANGGALRILHELHHGRRYLKTLSFGRHIEPETVFTFRSLFQELPAHDQKGELPFADLFIDENGRGLNLDLYDAQTWADHQWSAFRPDALRRLSKRRARSIFKDTKTRLEYLARQLERARLFQMALASNVEGYEVDQILSVQNPDLETARRALVKQTARGWELVFADDKAARKLDPSIRALLETKGDGHATIDSQNRLSEQERRVLLPVYHVGGSHYGVVQEDATQERLLEFFLAP